MSSEVDRVKIAPASLQHARSLAPRLRDIDRFEMEAATGLGPDIALRMALARPWRRTVTAIDSVEGPVAMGGVETGAGPRDGVVWLVGTDWLDRNPRTVLKFSRIWLEIFDKDYDHLWNYVHESNERARRWLEVLGFVVRGAQPYGVAQEPFCYFSRRVR